MITLDFETLPIGKRPDYPPRPVSVAIQYRDKLPEFLAWGHPSANNCTEAHARETLANIWASGEDILCHNAPFDLSVCYEYFNLPLLPWHRVHDTMFVLFLIDPHHGLGLKDAAVRHLGMPADEQAALYAYLWEHRASLPRIGVPISKSKMGAFIAYAPGDMVEPYALGDVVRTKALYDLLMPVVVQRGMQDAYDRERRLQPILMENERLGIRVDHARLETAVPLYTAALNEADEVLRDVLGAPGLSLDNDNDYADALASAGIVSDKAWKLTSTGRRSVAKGALTQDMYTNPLIHNMYQYRGKMATTLRMFLEPWLAQANQTNGTIHPRWHQVRAEFGGTCCMPAGELVQTARGWLPVEAVRVGDLVLTHTGRAREVTATHVNGVQPVWTVISDAGHTLRTTGNHEFRSGDGWIRADALDVGTPLVASAQPERWADIEGWPYEVSSWGRVRNRCTGYVLNQQPKGRWGHLKVALRRNGVRKRGADYKDFSVHRLVAAAFDVGGVGPEVRHLNSIAWDNCAANLRWGTSRENTHDARLVGKTSMRASPQAKLTDEAADTIRALPRATRPVKNRAHTNAELAKQYGVCARIIRDVRNGRRWLPCAAGLAPNHFFGARAVCVEEGAAEQTYGLTVADDHSHVTGGLVTHNTGRPSMSDPNLLNVAKSFEDAVTVPEGFPALPEVRGYMLPDEGHAWVHRDYDGQELRIYAHFERGSFYRMYRENPKAKPHDRVRENIKTVLGYDLGKTLTKNVNFGRIYGAGVPRIMSVIGAGRKEAEALLAAHEKAMPDLGVLKAELERMLRANQTVRTLGGRVVTVEPARVVDGRMRDFYYKLLNHLVQGSAADMTKEAIIRWHDRRADSYSRLLLTVYDEINVSAKTHMALAECDALKDAMASIPCGVSMLSEAKLGASWGTAKEIAQ